MSEGYPLVHFENSVIVQLNTKNGFDYPHHTYIHLRVFLCFYGA